MTDAVPQLDPRKSQILQALVESYIQTAAPVGSTTTPFRLAVVNWATSVLPASKQSTTINAQRHRNFMETSPLVELYAGTF